MDVMSGITWNYDFKTEYDRFDSEVNHETCIEGKHSKVKLPASAQKVMTKKINTIVGIGRSLKIVMCEEMPEVTRTIQIE